MRLTFESDRNDWVRTAEFLFGETRGRLYYDPQHGSEQVGQKSKLERKVKGRRKGKSSTGSPVSASLLLHHREEHE